MKSRRPVLIISAAILLVLLAGLSFWIHWRSGKTAASPEMVKVPVAKTTARQLPRPPTSMLRTHLGPIDLTADNPYPNVPAEYAPVVPASDDQPLLFYIQLNGKVTEEAKDELRAAGATILDYVPDNAVSSRMSTDTARRIRRLPRVKAVAPRAPYLAMGPYLRELIKSGDSSTKVNIFVEGFISEKISAARLVADGYPVHGRSRLAGRAVAMSATVGQLRSMLPRLLARPDVAWAQVKFKIRHASPPSLGTSPPYPAAGGKLANADISDIIKVGVENPAVPPAWIAALDGDGEVIAVTDSGCDEDHGMFYDDVNKLVTLNAVSPARRKVIAYFDMHGSNDYDGLISGYHGTHVAGTAAGLYHDPAVDSHGADNAYKGVASGAKLAINDIVRDDGVFDFGVGGYTQMVTNCTLAGAAVNNNSWGSWPGDFADYYDADSRSIDVLARANPNLLMVFSSGNEGAQAGGSQSFQGNAKNVLVVGATGDGSNGASPAAGGSDNGARAYFSSNGPTADGRIRPHVMAPGYWVWSADGDETTDDSADLGDDNYGVINLAGTSMSTPGVSGAAAIVRQYFREGYYPSGAAVGGDAMIPSAALMKAVLINSGVDLAGGNLVGGYIPDNTQGWGRVNLEDVLYFSGDTRNLRVIDDSTGVGTSETNSLFLGNTSTTDALRITLVWTDYPAAAEANPALVNDLNLVVTSPSGTVFRGNVFSAGASATKGSADTLNTEECVYIQTPEVGVYEIAVVGSNVPQGGKQPYALVVSGVTQDIGMLQVQGNGQNIKNNDMIPSVDDDTNFGAVAPGGTITNVFTLRNAGTDDVTIPSNAASIVGLDYIHFSVDQPTAGDLAPGESVTFSVHFSPVAFGIKAVQINVDYTAASPETFKFAVQGTGGTPAIQLSGKGVVIPSGSGASADNDTDFGSIPSFHYRSHRFTIHNTGNTVLQLTSTPYVQITGANPEAFSVAEQPADPIVLWMGTSTFLVRYRPTAVGQQSATVEIRSTATGQSLYTFTVSGEGTAFVRPLEDEDNGCRMGTGTGRNGGLPGFYLPLVLVMGVVLLLRRRCRT